MNGDSNISNIKSSIKEFSEETTLHGVRYLTKSDYAGCICCIWLVIILVMTATYAIVVSNSIHAYLR